jgi:omega-6 fatty acid desaturase (delta-12 desaturase)
VCLASSSVAAQMETCISDPVTASPRPRNGIELILATKPFAKDDTLKSWCHVISTLILFMAAIGASFASQNLIIRIACSFLQALLTLRLFVIYHDHQHHAILPHSIVADILMQSFGIYVLSASSVWKSSHNHHHNHNSKLRGSHIGSFPIMTKTQFLHSSRRARFYYLFARHPLTILLGYVFMFLFGMCLNPIFKSVRRHWDCLAALLLHVCIAINVYYFYGWVTLLLVQTIPFAVSCAIGTYLFYAQHNFPDVLFADQGGWTYEKAALESSSYLKTGPIMQWFTANIGFHHVHHLNSRIPFYRLPEAMKQVPELQDARTTSLDLRDVFECLSLKVWDVDRQQMVTLED